MSENDPTGSGAGGPSTPGIASFLDSSEAPPSAPYPDERSVETGPRYVPTGLIDEGGMGRVDRIYDRLLQRSLARKVMKPGLPRGAQARFRREARITARLQHPGIVPVLDMGETPDHQPYYLMPEVRWKRLFDRIPAEGSRDDPRQLRGLVEILRRICDIVAFAHEQGIVHRDLKPANVLVGDFGEVMVLDWGVAKDLRSGEAEGDDAHLLDVDATGTVVGRGIGTPGYMPPEQAQGEHVRTGPWSDVYALGVILHEMVLGRRPDGPVRAGDLPTASLDGVPQRSGYSPAVGVFADGGFSHGLDLICARALAADPDLRFPDGKALGQALADWLDGVYRREQATKKVQAARALEPEIASLRLHAAAHAERAARLLDRVTADTPLDVRKLAWAEEERASELARAAESREADRVQALRGALEVDPDLEEAHAALAAYHHAEHARACALGDGRASELHLLDLGHHDRARRYAAYLEGSGQLTLVTDPPGARVFLEEYVRRDHRLVPEPRGELARAPFTTVRLPRGSYRLRILAEGRAEVLYPVHIGHAEHWDGVPPNATEPAPVWLPPEDWLGPDDAYVPAGWFRFGGDGVAQDGLSARRLWVDGFVVRRHPVTVSEYFVFLNDLVAQGRRDEALQHAPDDGNGNRAYVDEGPGGRLRPGGRPFGDSWEPDWPVSLVDWRGARAYATWAATRIGRPCRLLHEAEREKAARGVDGRYYPWGDWPEALWTCMLASHAGPPRKRGVRALVDDVGPYGVTGMAGNVRDWCLNTFRREGPPAGSRVVVPDMDTVPALPVVRGGSFNSEARFCRVDARFASPPARRSNVSAIRLGWSVRER